MTTLITTIAGVRVYQDDTNRAWWTAGAQIDADGANGQFGAPAAYMVGNTGTEALANGGMKIVNGSVVFAADWGRDIVIWNSHGQPRVFPPGGIIASKTAYRFHDMAADNPAAYVDAETVPYAVVSPTIREKTKGIVLGCMVRMTNTLTGRMVNGVVADIGPRDKIGELSIAAARALGIPSSPRVGGTDAKVVLYEIFAGTPAYVNGVRYDLIRA